MQVTQYLTAMNIQFEAAKKFDDITIDIYIPAQKTIIKLIPPKYYNFDRTTYSGILALLKRVLETLKP